MRSGEEELRSGEEESVYAIINGAEGKEGGAEEEGRGSCSSDFRRGGDKRLWLLLFFLNYFINIVIMHGI